MTSLKSSLILTCVFMMGCSQTYNMVQYQRDETFFTTYQNPSAELSQAEAKIESIKLLQTSEEFPIRLAIYDNGKFYYQVDELGTGIGDWKFEDGGLKLTTRRKIFDMNFYVTAAAVDGNELVVKFFDRHGFNQYSLDFRNPNVMDANGHKPGKLREFKSSIKDI